MSAMSGSGGISLWSRVRELEGDALRQIQLELHKSDNNNANKRKILKLADFANFHTSQSFLYLKRQTKTNIVAFWFQN